jgi:hypothetical protein
MKKTAVSSTLGLVGAFVLLVATAVMFAYLIGGVFRTLVQTKAPAALSPIVSDSKFNQDEISEVRTQAKAKIRVRSTRKIFVYVA